MMIRIGLMGCGVVADYGHLPAIVGTEGLQLTALFDPNRPRLEAAGRKFGDPRLFTDQRAFFESGLDAVVVTSPAPCHLENVLMAAEYRKPVLCEKPLAMTDADAEQMVQAMEQAGQLLVVGYVYRFATPALKIRELIKQGAIGDVRSLRLVYDWDCHGKYASREPGVTALNERRHGRMIEGGPMVDCGVHQIDLARWWSGSEVVRFHGFGAWVDEYEAPDHVYVHMDHANGAHSMVESSFSMGHTCRKACPQYIFEAIGTHGVLRYDRELKRLELHQPTGFTDLGWAPEKGWEAMYAQFAAAVRTGELGTFASGRDGIINTRIAREATNQAMAGRVKA